MNFENLRTFGFVAKYKIILRGIPSWRDKTDKNPISKTKVFPLPEQGRVKDFTGGGGGDINWSKILRLYRVKCKI